MSKIKISETDFAGQVEDLLKTNLCWKSPSSPTRIARPMGKLQILLRMGATKRKWNNMVKRVINLPYLLTTYLTSLLISFNYGFVVNNAYSGISHTSTLSLRASQSCFRVFICRFAVDFLNVIWIRRIPGASSFSLSYLASFQSSLMFLLSDFWRSASPSKRLSLRRSRISSL